MIVVKGCCVVVLTNEGDGGQIAGTCVAVYLSDNKTESRLVGDGLFVTWLLYNEERSVRRQFVRKVSMVEGRRGFPTGTICSCKYESLKPLVKNVINIFGLVCSSLF